MKKKVKSQKSKKYNKTALGIAALTLAISGIFLTFFASPIVAPIFIIVALVFAIIQQTKNPTKMGKSALILGIISVVVYVVWIILLFKVLLPLAEQAMQQGIF